MKKMVSLILAVVILALYIPVFAEEAANQTNEQEIEDQAVASEEESVTEEVYEEIIAIEDEEELTEEYEEILDEIEADETVTRENINATLKNIYKYLVKRDLYYKRVLNVLHKIEQTDNKALKAAAIIEFEQRYNRQKELDRRIHQRIEKAFAFLKEHQSELKPAEKVVIRQLFKPVIEKYNKHRKMIVYVHRKIDQIKENTLVDEVAKLVRLAEQYENQGKYKEALANYEEAISYGTADKTLYNKAGLLLRKMEGNGPKVFVDGNRPLFDEKPIYKNGRTMVPIRAVAEALGAKVEWDPILKSSVIVKGNKRIVVPIGKNYIIVNGKNVSSDVPAMTVGDRILVPFRIISENLDAKVTFDQDTEVITIEDSLGDEDYTDISSEAASADLGDAGEYDTDVTAEEVIEELESLDETTVDENADSIDTVTP